MDEEVRIIRAANLDKGFFQGTWNSMNSGTIIKNPRFLFRQKNTQNLAYGDFYATIMHIDKIISLNHHGLTIDKIWKYKMKNEPIVYLYYIPISGIYLNQLIRGAWQFKKGKKGWVDIGKKVI